MKNKKLDWYDILSLRLVEKYWDGKLTSGLVGMLDDYFLYNADYGSSVEHPFGYTAGSIAIANSPDTAITSSEGAVVSTDVEALLNAFFALYSFSSTDIVASHDSVWTPDWSPVDGLAVSLPQKILEGKMEIQYTEGDEDKTAVLPVSFLIRFNGEKVHYLKVFIDMKPILPSGTKIPDAFRNDATPPM